MNKVFTMLGSAIKKLTTKVQEHPKTSAADLLLMELMGGTCQLQFERQDEVFEGVLHLSDGGAWQCDAIFQAHWLNAIEVYDDGSYTICVRIPDGEFAEDLLSMDCDEMLTYEDEENEGRSPDCEDWR